MRPKLVIFDCDGVLVDTERATNEVLIEDLSSRGFHVTLEEAFQVFVGGTIAGVAQKVRDAGTDLPDDWVDFIYERMFARLRKGVDPVDGIDGVLDLLDRLKIPYAVGSNGPPKKMDITLGGNGMLNRFGRHVYSAHVVGIAKPDPGLYLHVADQFGIAPLDCAVIEDSQSGAIAARDAGMRCFGYCADTPADRLSSVGAIVFDNMDALPGLLHLEA